METLFQILNFAALLFATLTLYYFIHLLFPRHRPRYLEIRETNNLHKARDMIVEDSNFAWEGFEIVTNEACAPVYNDNNVAMALAKTIAKHKIKPENAKVIVGPIITTIEEYNELINLYLEKKITIRQLEETPKIHFRLFGPRLYIEEPHDNDPNAPRTFYRLHSIKKYISAYSQHFDDLWKKAKPLPKSKETIRTKALIRENTADGTEKWVQRNDKSKLTETCLS